MNKGMNRILSIGVSALLSISTFLTVIPQTETIVYADDILEVSELRQIEQALLLSTSQDLIKIRITSPISTTSGLSLSGKRLEIVGGELNVGNDSIDVLNGGYLKLSGGTISGSGDRVIYLTNNTSSVTFEMSGGTITNSGNNSCTGVIVNYGTFNMTGGTISSTGNGGTAVEINNGTFNMNGGSITVNDMDHGFAIDRSNTGTLNYSSGTISGTVNDGSTTKYAVVFHANNGTDATDSQIMARNTSTALKSLSTLGFTYAGHNFLGWATSTPATSVTYTDGASVSLRNNIQLYAVWEATTYTVSMTNDGNGTASASPTSGATNTEVAVTATPNSNYLFKEWQVISGGVTLSSTTNNPATFNIGTANVEIKAIFEQNSPTDHTITVRTDGHGTAQASPTSASNETAVTLSATPSTGYEFDRWTTNDNINIINPTSASDAWFRMIDSSVTVRANFKAKATPKKDDNDNSDHEDSPAPSNNKNIKVPDGCEELRQLLVKAAASGKPETVKWNKGTSLPYDVMKMLHDNPNVTLVFSYTYLRQNYTVTIPGSAAIANPAVPWYGPIYLYALYGNTKISALTTNTKATTGNYTVKSGDTLSAIARRLKTTIKHLKDVNNIKDVDRIKPGMVLKY